MPYNCSIDIGTASDRPMMFDAKKAHIYMEFITKGNRVYYRRRVGDVPTAFTEVLPSTAATLYGIAVKAHDRFFGLQENRWFKVTA